MAQAKPQASRYSAEMFTVYGATDGVNTDGTVALYAPVIFGTDDFLQIPRGMKLKIHAIRISAEAVAPTDTYVQVRFTHDVVTNPPEPTPSIGGWAGWQIVTNQFLDVTDDPRMNEDKRKPIILPGLSGLEAIAVSWVQVVACEVYIELDVEYTQM